MIWIYVATWLVATLFILSAWRVAHKERDEQ